MEVESVLVTGANRGLGLEFVRQLVQLAKPPLYVFATYRDSNSTKALEEIRDASKETKVVLIQMDVTNQDDIQRARKTIEDTVGDRGLTFLINNAGVIKFAGFPEVTKENLLLHFNTNAMAPILVLKEMIPLLQKSAARKSTGMSVSRAAVLNISSFVASIHLLPEQKKEWLAVIGYRSSKAALNMAMRVVALTIKDQGILVVNMCPGYVKTDMTSHLGDMEPPESISAMLKTISQLDESHHGTYINRYGEPIPY